MYFITVIPGYIVDLAAVRAFHGLSMSIFVSGDG